MVVDEIDVEGVTVFEPENQPPVTSDPAHEWLRNQVRTVAKRL